MEVHPGVVHHRLVLEPAEAELVREAFELYVGQSGAKSVARTLNQRGYRTRAGALWSKNLVMLLLEEEALTGTVWWGRRKGRALRPKEEWMSLKVEPIIDTETWALAQQLRGEREPKRTPGRAPTRPKLLKGLAWCGKCGASYQYETGGKTVINGHYTYGSTTVETSCASGRKRAADSGSRPRRWMRPSWGRSRGSSAPRNAGEIWRAAVVGPSTGFSTPGARLFAARR